ncbi:MAG: hypothetical protein GY928_04230 [Colwellia sp.]|nr:hypothetical protein [Colwellia sp.]
MNSKYIVNKPTGHIMENIDLTYRNVFDYIKRTMPKDSRWQVANEKKIIKREYFWHYVSEYVGYQLCQIELAKPYPKAIDY